MPDPKRFTWTRSSPVRMVILCDILIRFPAKPITAIRAAPPRSMKAEGISDTASSVEAGFFVFDDVKYKADPYNTGFKLDSRPNCGRDDCGTGSLGHRRARAAVFPVDSCQDVRSEMLTAHRACVLKSITTKWRQLCTNSASSSTRWCATRLDAAL